MLDVLAVEYRDCIPVVNRRDLAYERASGENEKCEGGYCWHGCSAALLGGSASQQYIPSTSR